MKRGVRSSLSSLGTFAGYSEVQSFEGSSAAVDALKSRGKAVEVKTVQDLLLADHFCNWAKR